jgi:hypothetical protein
MDLITAIIIGVFIWLLTLIPLPPRAEVIRTVMWVVLAIFVFLVILSLLGVPTGLTLQ